MKICHAIFLYAREFSFEHAFGLRKVCTELFKSVQIAYLADEKNYLIFSRSFSQCKQNNRNNFYSKKLRGVNKSFGRRLILSVLPLFCLKFDNALLTGSILQSDDAEFGWPLLRIRPAK